jgi:predicted HD phosphohydrolase
MKTEFTELKNSTQEDWGIIVGEQMKFWQGLPDRILAHMELLGGDYGGFPIDRLQHCLQSANLAAEGGEDEEYIVCALLHDIGDTLGSTNHADVGAAILQPFVSEENHWMIKHHAIFQGYNFFHHLGLDRNMRDQFKSHKENFDRTARFIARYDNPAFDHKAPELSLSLFEDMVKNVFSKPKQSLYKKVADEAME